MGQWLWVIKDLGVLIRWKRNWKKGYYRKGIGKKACYLENYINQQNKTKRTPPFSSSLHLPESAHKMLANTHNITTKLTNNVVILLSSCFPKEGKNTLHCLLILTVKLVTRNEDKRRPFSFQLGWGFLRLLFLSFLSVCCFFFFSFGEGKKMFHQSVVVYSFQEEIHIYKGYTWNVYLNKHTQKNSHDDYDAAIIN